MYYFRGFAIIEGLGSGNSKALVEFKNDYECFAWANEELPADFFETDGNTVLAVRHDGTYTSNY